MRERTLKARIRKFQKQSLENIASRTARPGQAFWLSFADSAGFRGAVIVHAEDFLTAITECNLRGINPHGECQGVPISAEDARLIPEKWKYRILSRADCEQFDREMLKGAHDL